MKKKIILIAVILLLLVVIVTIAYAALKCPICGLSMYWTGKTDVEWGKLMYQYRCPAGHVYWFPAGYQ